MSNRVNHIDNYFKVKIESASPMTLIHMVYERAIKTLSDAKANLKARNRDKFSENVLHAQDCIRELRTSLNLEVGEIAHSLFRLYDYMINQLIDASITRENPLPLISRVENMLMELDNTWRVAEKKLQNQERSVVRQESQALSLVG